MTTPVMADGRGHALQEMVSALQRLSSLLAEADPSWCVYGSLALALNGVPGIEVHDVDVLMSAEGVQRLMRNLPQVQLLHDDKPGGRFRSLHARVYMGGVEIDLSGDLQLCQDGVWTPVSVESACLWQGIRFASLSSCILLLRQFARPKDLARLELVDEACRQGLCGQQASPPAEP